MNAENIKTKIQGCFLHHIFLISYHSNHHTVWSSRLDEHKTTFGKCQLETI